MARKVIDGTASNGRPDLYCIIPATGSNARPIRRPRHGAYQSPVITIHTNKITAAGVPYMHIVVARGDVLRIGRPGHRIDQGRMAVIDVDIVTVGGVPYHHFRVETARGDAA